MVGALEAELASLSLLAASYASADVQTSEQLADAKRVEELDAHKKLSSDIETFVERLLNLDLMAKTKLCAEACVSGPVTSYITRLRRVLLTPSLRDNFKAEVKAFGCGYAHVDGGGARRTANCIWREGVGIDDRAFLRRRHPTRVKFIRANYGGT